MISFLLIVLYTILSVFWLLKISRSYRNYLSAQQVTFSFIIKVVFGMLYGFLFLKFYHGDDTWQYHNYALTEYHQLRHHPLQFIQDIRVKASGSSSVSAIYDTQNSLWNKLDDVLFVKMLVIFDVFSFGHYYVNVVLYCLLGFIGHLLLFRLLIRYYPAAASLLILAIFYIPMVIFWLSGIRKEGLIFLAMSMVLFYFDRFIRREKYLVTNLFFLILGLALLMLMRNFIVMCILPALVAWFLSTRFKLHTLYTFLGTYCTSIFVFFLSGSVPGFPDLAQKVAQRQHDFMGLVAKTRLPLDSLKGTPASYLHVLPQAINHSFIRPYFTEAKGVLQIISAAEIIVFFGLLFIVILYHRSGWRDIFANPVLLTLLFTAFLAYLIIGYTVPFPGAFVRYKSVFEVLFFCIFAIVIDSKRVRLWY